jgi:hypothetical protein
MPSKRGTVAKAGDRLSETHAAQNTTPGTLSSGSQSKLAGHRRIGEKSTGSRRKISMKPISDSANCEFSLKIS